MTGRVGDRIIVETERVGQPDRVGEILEAIEADYGTRYRVRWEDGHESDIRPAAGSARFEPAASPQASPGASSGRRSGSPGR